ncbi:MAG TPA: polysaccharide biosynthesis/export family protein [Opitutaceae bacterium]|nr:polysaccharide biosynthesis/export family protein [Opitutaceae bacterium]
MSKLALPRSQENQSSSVPWLRRTSIGLLIGSSLFLSGCNTTTNHTAAEQLAPVVDAQKLREGDVVKITFPTTPVLDTQQTIRPDGRVTLSMLGEIRAVGMTPLELEQELLKRYATQLVSNEVIVSVVSSSYSVYLTGAVRSPGRLQTDRPLTVLESILQGGGFAPRAKTTAVDVIRTQDGKVQKFTLNLQKVLDGQDAGQFYLQPNDYVIVPEKFQWF